MRPELRPLNLGEVLDRTFQIYRSAVLPFITIAVMAAAMTTAWSGVQIVIQRTARASGHAGIAPWLPFVQVLGLPIVILTYTIVSGAMTLAVGSLYQHKPWTAGSVLRALFSRWSTLVGLALTVMVLCAGLFVLVGGGLAGVVAFAPRIRSMSGASALTVIYGVLGFSLLFLLPLCLWLGLRYSLALPVCSFEQVGIRQSLRRSAALSRGMRWRIFAMTIVYFIVASILSSVVFIPVTLFSRSTLLHPPLWYTLYGLVIGFASRAVALPICGIGLAVFYFDARIRNEGLDVEWSLADAAPQPPPPLVPGESAAIG